VRRYAPGRPLPPYAFVPGHWPHPRGEGGHAQGQAEPPEEALDPAAWTICEAYLYGIDLFNHGYYWEAHEAWEGPWRAAPGATPEKALLQGLIRLAAAGVKLRQGILASVRSHGEAAERLFLQALEATGGRPLCGLDLLALTGFARRVAAEQSEPEAGEPVPVRVVFADQLVLTGFA